MKLTYEKLSQLYPQYKTAISLDLDTYNIKDIDIL
jgi:hypothetical protein